MSTSEPRQPDPATRLTLGVIFYNQETFAEQAVLGALNQSYSPLEIVFSDDASTDKTFDVIQRMVRDYEGPHELILNRNSVNVGIAGNVNRVMELASGEIVLLAYGDDVSMPNRAARAAEALEAEDDCLCVSFGMIGFEGPEIPVGHESGQETSCRRITRSEYAAVPFFHLNAPGRAFRRRAFEFFGPIATECPTDDTVMLLRCFLLGDVLVAPDPQVYYRLHEGGVTQGQNLYRIDPAVIHRQYLRDIAIAVERGLLADDDQEQLRATLELRLKRRILQRDLHFASSRIAALKIVVKSKGYRGRKKVRMLAGVLRPSRRY